MTAYLLTSTRVTWFNLSETYADSGSHRKRHILIKCRKRIQIMQ